MLPRLLLALLLVGGATWLPRQQKPQAEAGIPAPPLAIEKWLEPAENSPRSWDDLRGQVVLLEFWATWCGPCVAAIPHWNELVEKFRGRPVQFISVTDEEEAVVRKFLAARPIKGWLALDTDGSMSKAYSGGEALGIPTTLIIAPDGTVVGKTHPEAVTEALLEQLLSGDVAGVRAKLSAAQVPSIEEGIRGKQASPALFEVLIRPGSPNYGGMSRSPGKFAAQGVALRDAIANAYGMAGTRIVMDEVLGNTLYDVLGTVPRSQADSLNRFIQQALETAFSLRVRREMREVDVFEMVAPNGPKPALRPWASGGGMTRWGRGKATSVGMPLGSLASLLESVVGKPVIDETKLTGKFDFELTWDEKDRKSMVAAVREQLGLELRPARRPVELLIVEAAPPPPKPAAK
jgi:uncharacterized protein (TIGR03435 family)